MPRRSPLDSDMYERLGPSRFSALGFLGEDVREWDEILAQDEQTLERLGLARAELVRALQDVYSAAQRADGDCVEVAPQVFAESRTCRGRVPSPFPGEGTFPKHQVRVFQENSDTSFLITPLSLHLIEKYGFFQGIGSPFRIDPELAATMLGLGAKRHG